MLPVTSELADAVMAATARHRNNVCSGSHLPLMKDTVDLAHDKVVEILQATIASPLTAAQAKALDDLVERRAKELSS